MQRSSATVAGCGSSSLIHAPDWPCCANWKGDGATGKRLLARAHRREPLAIADRVGQLLAMPSGAVRLVVEQVHLRRPAVHEQVDHALGLRRQVRMPSSTAGDLPPAGVAAAALAFARAARPAPRTPMPTPVVARPKNWRRVWNWRSSSSGCIDGVSPRVQCCVMVSSRFSSTLAVMVQAASSQGSRVGSAGDSPWCEQCLGRLGRSR